MKMKSKAGEECTLPVLNLKEKKNENIIITKYEISWRQLTFRQNTFINSYTCRDSLIKHTLDKKCRQQNEQT